MRVFSRKVWGPVLSAEPKKLWIKPVHKSQVVRVSVEGFGSRINPPSADRGVKMKGTGIPGYKPEMRGAVGVIPSLSGKKRTKRRV